MMSLSENQDSILYKFCRRSRHRRFVILTTCDAYSDNNIGMKSALDFQYRHHDRSMKQSAAVGDPFGKRLLSSEFISYCEIDVCCSGHNFTHATAACHVDGPALHSARASADTVMAGPCKWNHNTHGIESRDVPYSIFALRRHQITSMMTSWHENVYNVLLALCEGNPPVTGSPHKGPVYSFDVVTDVS